MKSRLTKLSSFLIIPISIFCSIAFIGTPDQHSELELQVRDRVQELYQAMNSSDGSKASFLSQGFCFNGGLEELSYKAQTPKEIELVDSLGRDCRIVTELLKTEA